MQLNLSCIRKALIFVILLCTILLQALPVFATGNNETPESGAKDSGLLKAGDDYTLPIVKEKITLSYAGQDSFAAQYSLNDNREIWQEFEKRTNIKIEWQCVGPAKDYRQSVQLRTAAGVDMPDMLHTLGLNVVKLHNDGLTIKTTELIDKYAPNIKKYIKANKNIRAVMIASDNQMYAAMCEVKKHNENTNVQKLYYRDDWRKQLGFKEPETIEDYFEIMKAFKTKDPNGNGKADEVPIGVPRVGSFGTLGTAYDIMGTWQVDKNGKVMYNAIRPEFKEFMAMLHKMYKAGVLPKSVIIKNNQINQAVATNRAGMYNQGLGKCAANDLLLSKAGVDLKLGGYNFAPPPINKYTGKRAYIPPNYVHDRFIAITKKCKYPEVAIRWVDYVLASEEGQILTNYGIEGKSYTIGKDGKPQFTDWVLNNPDGLDIQVALRSLGSLAPMLNYYRADAFHNQFIKNEKLYNIPKRAKKYFSLENDLPQVLATVEEAEDFNQINSDVNTYKEEMELKFILGDTPLDKFPEFIENMQKLGIEKLTQIQQNKYDRLQKMD